MKRRAALRRGAPMKRGTTPIPRSPMARHARPAAETVRAHGTPAHRAWIKGQPCVICGRTPSDAAHLKNGGMSRKDDVCRTVPLCADVVPMGYAGHHSEYDGGKRSFRAKYAHVDLEAEAARAYADWLCAA